MSSDVLFVSFSAFFADMGYQTVIALFPIFFIVVLGASAYDYGIVNAVAFGGGAMFGYLGGLAGDRYGNRLSAIAGNALIPLISLVALTQSIPVAVMLFSGGWWARNFRSPPRRAMLVNGSSEKNRGKVFGFLHLLDIGGGMLSIVALLIMLYFRIQMTIILLITMLPLLLSTISLILSKEKKRRRYVQPKRTAVSLRGSKNAYLGIIMATALYGFSVYGLGFPILTITAEAGSSLVGVGSYAVYLGVSAIVGYLIGSSSYNRIRSLSYLGYVLSGIGSIVLGVGYAYGLGDVVAYGAVAMLGFAFGVIETLEPTLISLIRSAKELGKGLGALSGARSLGIFSANLIMGILYVVNPFYSYLYAGAISIIAGAIVLFAGRELS